MMYLHIEKEPLSSLTCVLPTKPRGERGASVPTADVFLPTWCPAGALCEAAETMILARQHYAGSTHPLDNSGLVILPAVLDSYACSLHLGIMPCSGAC